MGRRSRSGVSGFIFSALPGLVAAFAFMGAALPHRDVPTISVSSAAVWNRILEAGIAEQMREGLEESTEFLVPAPAPPLPDPGEYTLEEIELRDLTLDTAANTLQASKGEIQRGGYTGESEVLPDAAPDSGAEMTPAADDSLDIPPSDSTNRIKFLPLRSRRGALSTPFPDRVSPIYLEPSSPLGIQRIVKVDSARNVVLIREVVNGKDVRIPVEMPLDQYIRQRYDYERNRRTAAYAGKYEEKQGDKLSDLFKNLTEFEIPVPPNPLMSIFGDRNRISLRISGAIDINAGFRIEKSDQQSVFLNQTQFTPNFKQRVQINVNGLVGDKLSIKADWSTERTFDYENQLKIKYTGYEDEIIQNIEAGNVSLQTPSTLVAGSGALFGIRADFQFGPFRLSTIASQKKGESSRISVSGGSTEQKFERHAWEYSENHYWMSLAYREPDPTQGGQNVYESYYNFRAQPGAPTAPRVIRPDLVIKDLEVWITRPATAGVTLDPEERQGVAFINDLDITFNQSDADLPPAMLQYADPTFKVESQSGLVEVGNFKRLKKDIEFTYNPYTGVLTMNQSVQEDQVIGVAFRVEGATSSSSQDDEFYGTFVNDPRLTKIPSARLVLKLVKPKNLSPAFVEAWKHRVKSIYSLNARNLRPEDIENVKIVFRSGSQPDQEVLPSTPFNLLRLFGLDYTTDAGGGPDGKIDFTNYTIDAVRGEIIFPTIEPWNDGLRTLYQFLRTNTVNPPDPNVIEDYVYPDVYDTTKTIARQSPRDKLLIVGAIKGTGSAQYNLGFNVVQGSVRVLLNGQPLTPGTDYTVDEVSGQVRILKEEALVPGAKVDIDYEKQDLFSFASKTLIGARGELALGKNSAFGFTLLSLNQKTLSDKVRIGEEPISNTMFGVDVHTQHDLPFVTEALNTLPFIQTKEKSTLTFQAEGAVIMPDPNTKKSTIPSDEGKGIAYLDDFEGSRVFIPLQTAYSVWRLASVPASLPTYPVTPPDTVLQNRRARLNWYNLPLADPSGRSVVVTDIWPNKLAAREDQRVTVLDLDYYPDRRGMFNYRPDLATDLEQNWAGIMRLLPVNATNLVDGNYNYIELWMRVESENPRAKLVIDLGKVSEDAIPNSQLNSEDLAVVGSIQNGILNAGEDVGLDMTADAEEKVRFATEVAQFGLDPNDPSGDNFNYDVANWDQFNGTEGNQNDPAGTFPDTEDLNNNGILDLTNDYFQYEIDLDTNRFNPADPGLRNPYVVGGGTNGWYQFRVPLSAFRRTIGSPALDNVEFIRVLVTGASVKSSLRIAEFNFVGNQWYERIRNDSLFTVSVVNIEDNPDYSSPPGVIRERDRRRPDQEVYGNEQSLALLFHSLPVDSLRESYRLFPGNGLDLFNYERMKMYVHGDPALAADTYELVVRFGTDTANYYEYRAPVYPGWDERNEMSIRFTDITALKSVQDSCNTVERPKIDGPPGAFFLVRGCPDIVSVRTFSVGVRNRNTSGRAVSGQVWVNELRVIGPNDKKGYAYMGSVNLRMADIADINATFSHSDPYFHTIAEHFSATRANTTNWSASTTLNIDKVFPKEWQGTQVRVAYTHAENLTKPLLLPGRPDVEVEASLLILANDLRNAGASQSEIDLAVRNARIASQTLEIRDTWAIPTVRLKAPGKNWLVDDIVNRLETSFNYSIIRFRDPVVKKRRQWQWQARVGYGYDFGRNAYIQPFSSIFNGIFLLDFYKDAKYYYLPTRVGLSADLNRSRIEENRRDLFELQPYVRTFLHSRSGNLGYTMAEGGLLNLTGSYSSTLQSSLLHLETEPLYTSDGLPLYNSQGIQEVRQRLSSEIFNDIFFGRGSLYFGKPISYTQAIQLSSRPGLPRFFNIDRYFDLSGTYNVTYNWQESLQQQGLGRTASYNATANVQLNLRLKALFDPLFESQGEGGGTVPPGAGGGRNRPSRGEMRPGQEKGDAADLEREVEDIRRRLSEANPEDAERLRAELQQKLSELAASQQTKKPADAQQAGSDSLKLAGDSLNVQSRFPSIGKILSSGAYYLIKIPFLDYENFSITFTENNNSTVSGVRGETGFSTFWTSSLTGNPTNPDEGPSRLYQLGLVSDPNPSSGTIGFSRRFPFLTIRDYKRGLRFPNPNGVYVDNYAQSNTFSMRTNRPLWEGARVDLNWDLRWSTNKNYTLRVDSLGQPTVSSVTTTGQIERSYLAFPDFLFFHFFGTNMNSVNERYQTLLNDPTDQRNDAEKLAEAFEEGFEAFPWLSHLLTDLFPRVNWSLRWDGLEKISFIEGFADRISLEHRYTSNLTTSFRNSQDTGERIIDSKRAGYNFAPLIGLSFNFSKIWGGDLSVNTRWGKQQTFDLNTSASNIVSTATDEISINASFRKNGFELPIFGLALKNDIDFSLAFSLTKNESRTFLVTASTPTSLGAVDTEGQPREGTTRISMEPRVRYSVSQRVQASLFYRYQRTKPDSSVGSRVPGTTIHEGGLEIRINITGS